MVTPAAKRDVVSYLRDSYAFSERRACTIVGLCRGSYRYQAKPRDDDAIKKRLRELAERLGAKAYLIDNAVQMNKSWFNGVSSVGVTAGASAPEVLIQEVLDTLQAWGGDVPSELSGIEENVTFSLPKSLR